MFGILIALFVIGWVTAALIGTQAYFLGEQRKPIHERNWGSDSFDKLAKSITGRETSYGDREPGYRIGAYAANHKAEKISTFTTCTLYEKLCWITSAALSPNKKKLVLLDSQSIWLFENWKKDDFFSGDVYKIDLGIVTQKESVTFYDDNTIVFTDEEFMGIGRNAYVIKLDEQDKMLIKSRK